MPIKHLFFQSNSPAQQVTYWGAIQGNLELQADLKSQLDSKSDLNHEHINLYEPKNSNIQNHIGDNDIHLPDFTNQSGKFLKNDSSHTFWADLPNQLTLISTNVILTVKTGVVDGITTFNTLADALSYLNDKWIMNNCSVIIEIENGIFTSTSAITINHPCSDKIKISGKNSYSANFTNLYSYSGTSGNYSVIFTVNDISNIEVGNYLMIKSPSTNLNIIRGCWKVTAVDTANKRVTCYITTARGNPATGSLTGSFNIIKTVLKFTSSTGIEIQTPLNEINKIVLEGALITGQNISGLYINKSSLNCGSLFGINSFETGLKIFSGSGFIDGIMISGCKSGTLGYGLYLINSINVIAKGCYLSGNYYNIFSSEMSRLDCRNSVIMGSANGIYSERLSFTDANGCTFDNTLNFSPSENIYGNIQAYINTN